MKKDLENQKLKKKELQLKWINKKKKFFQKLKLKRKKFKDNLKKKDFKEKKIILHGNLNKIELDQKKKEKKNGLDFKGKKNLKSKESKRN